MAKKKASEMSVLEVADAIQWCMGKMQENMNKLPDLAEQKAKSESEYDKQIEIAVLELKENNAATLVKDLAKGKCSDYKYKMSIAKKGKPNHRLGKHHTMEARKKIGLAHKGNTYNKGRILTVGHRRKLSLTMKDYWLRQKFPGLNQ